MTLVILTILVLAYVLIATENVTKVNRAAVAIFAGTVGWVLFVCFGMDFVTSEHLADYSRFLHLGDADSTSTTVKYYISRNIFLPWVGRAAEIVLFLLATMTIVEILSNNGCFDFVRQLLRTRSSKKMLWTLAIVTFLISINLDNLTTTVMMLTMMHAIIPSRRQRMIYGSAILLAANCGGALTVIGNPEGLVLWNSGAVTATVFSFSLLLPCLAAWLIPTAMMMRMLPERVDSEWIVMPYRGDDTRLNAWQRQLMLFVGIGGLWFIPTFHNITKLSPFLGALCVLSVLWVVHEVFNRKLMNADQNIQRSIPRVLQYGAIQQILFVLAILLAMGMAIETGALLAASEWVDYHIHNVWIVGLISGVLSSVIDTFTVAMSNASFYDVIEGDLDRWWVDADYMLNFVQNGAYWKLIAYTTAIGGCLFGYANMSGLALMKMEHVRVGWYLRHCTLKIMIGWLLGLAVLYAECELF